jgi:general secretion pathway protein D
VDATGQTRTTYDYKDIGIVLNAEPVIHLDNSSTVKMKLEVSTLGENLGTANEPAFRIGTRIAETFMTLRDGETAILGGLIRDEERNTRVKIPGFGDIPIIGALFTSYDDSAGRTDVLLTITPRVVRGWDLPTKTAREFYSGSENVYSDKPIFADLNVAAVVPPGAKTTPKIDAGSGSPATAAASPALASATAPGGTTASGETPASPAPIEGATTPSASLAAPPLLAFAEPVYEVATGQEFEIELVGQNLIGVTSLPVQILYNPQLLSFVRGERGDPAPQAFAVEADEAKGLLQVRLSYASGTAPKDSGVLARLTLRGAKPGISYLVYRTPSITNAAGESVNAQVRASRIVIK